MRSDLGRLDAIAKILQVGSLLALRDRGQTLAKRAWRGRERDVILLKIPGVSHESSLRRGCRPAGRLTCGCPNSPVEFAAGQQACQDPRGKGRRGGARQGLQGLDRKSTRLN